MSAAMLDRESAKKKSSLRLRINSWIGKKLKKKDIKIALEDAEFSNISRLSPGNYFEKAKFTTTIDPE